MLGKYLDFLVPDLARPRQDAADLHINSSKGNVQFKY